MYRQIIIYILLLVIVYKNGDIFFILSASHNDQHDKLFKASLAIILHNYFNV